MPTLTLIRVITRSINYISALLGALELSLVIDLMFPFLTPLNNKNKQKAFCCYCEEKSRSADTTGAHRAPKEWGRLRISLLWGCVQSTAPRAPCFGRAGCRAGGHPCHRVCGAWGHIWCGQSEVPGENQQELEAFRKRGGAVPLCCGTKPLGKCLACLLEMCLQWKAVSESLYSTLLNVF